MLDDEDSDDDWAELGSQSAFLKMKRKARIKKES